MGKNVISKLEGKTEMTIKNSIEISRTMWKLIIWTPVIIGTIIFSVLSSSFFIPKEYSQVSMFASMGLLLVGWGFGLAYARVFKIRGIDN